MAVAWPVELVGEPVHAAAVRWSALYPAVAPRGRGATVGGRWSWWPAGSSTPAGTTTPVALWRVLAIATLLYLGHTLAALAAVLPYDAVVNLDVVVAWLVRALRRWC